MLSRAPNRLSTTHLLGIWGYLRHGVAVCAAFFAVCWLVSLAQNGSWQIFTLLVASAMFLIVIGTAAVAPKNRALSPPALAEGILAHFLGPEENEHIIGDLAEAFRQRATLLGTTNARVWYWTQIVRTVPAINKDIAMKTLVDVLTRAAVAMSFIMR